MKRFASSLAFSTAVLASTWTLPAHAFFDEVVLGMTSVSNNLIDSSESVANNAISTGSTTILLLSRDIGKMADRIGLMADRIGVMADRIVLTESMLANLAHKVVDTGAAARTQARAAPAAAMFAAVPLACAAPTSQGQPQVC